MDISTTVRHAPRQARQAKHPTLPIVLASAGPSPLFWLLGKRLQFDNRRISAPLLAHLIQARIQRIFVGVSGFVFGITQTRSRLNATAKANDLSASGQGFEIRPFFLTD